MYFGRGPGRALAGRYFQAARGNLPAAVQVETWRSGEQTGSVILSEWVELVGWMEGVDPSTGEAKGRICFGERPDRKPLRFVGVLVNNPKSWSVVASQNPVVARKR